MLSFRPENQNDIYQYIQLNTGYKLSHNVINTKSTKLMHGKQSYVFIIILIPCIYNNG